MKEEHFGPIWFIPGENKGKYPFCHSVYIEGAGVLIDPASDRERLLKLRKDHGVKMVWLSHAHEDHLMHLDLFDDLPLWISDKESALLSSLETFLDWYEIDQQDYRQYWDQFLKEEFHFKPRKPSQFLQGGQVIQLDGVTVDVISTPGHTSGHLAFFFREPKVLFMGDYDLTRFGPWYGNLDSSIEETIESINLLKKLPAEVFLTSHEEGVFKGDPGKLWDDYLNVIHERNRRLLVFLIQPRTMEEIVGAWIVYGREREPKAFFELGERALMKKHLDHLMKLGKVFQEKDRYVKML
ncbi:MAG: MBL fold metallo-hydrolase [Deltaproteobacteria bacterium]|nr:MBL fold metallo-hydrolase [Deltaproteobacteria bacterium]